MTAAVNATLAIRYPYCEGTVTAALAAAAVGAFATRCRGTTIWRVFRQRSGAELYADRVDTADGLPVRSMADGVDDTTGMLWLDTRASMAVGSTLCVNEDIAGLCEK